MKRKILIVYHSMSGNTATAAREVARGVKKVKGVRSVVKRAVAAKARDLVTADGYCFGTPDYFSQMAGMLKDFFDRTLYSSKGRAAGKPCGLFVSHGGGGAASRNLEGITRAFKVKRVGETVLVKGKPGRAAKQSLRALGVKVGKAVLKNVRRSLHKPR